jgi:hypothetical protein
MKPKLVLLLTASILAHAVMLPGQGQPSPTPTESPVATASPVAYEPLPTLDASVILQPQYLRGPNFTVRNSVPTYFGSNHYTIDSDFGVFEADGNDMLMRRVAEIRGCLKSPANAKFTERGTSFMPALRKLK